jgi:NOL1/NOP2/sun family putative RNA methylase
MDIKLLLKITESINLKPEDFAVFGSGPLGIRNLRESKDIDIVVNKNAWEKLLKTHKPIKNKIDYGEHINIENIEIYKDWKPWINETAETLIESADIIKGIRFVKLRYVLEWKKEDKREGHIEKNARDIILIEKFMQNFSKETQKPKYKFNPKPEFEQRMNEILKLNNSDEQDIKKYWEIVHKEPLNYIRCNTLKISPNELKEKLEKDNKWKILQPFKAHEEIMLIENPLLPGQLGRSKEHLLGYYYVQELSSMLPILALNPTENDSFLDVCASPGSKTTQAAAKMKNKGSIIANDSKLGRLVVLASNLEKCGVSNTILTKRDGANLSRKLKKTGITFNKILVDAPCSGEGTLRSSPKTFIFWNEKMIKVFAGQQKALAFAALDLLEEEGEMIYSTCTHAPEENEEIVQLLLENFDIKIENIKNILPIKSRSGLKEWKNKVFNKQMENCARIYPQDNNTEGFFLAKIKKLSSRMKNNNSDNVEESEGAD